ncbi:peptidase P60 [Martelella lutilitoris]|uniref:Peptidase P60 n=1 Tax=Martelella lutilitoris TaxID=2583532 RepID=A0A5C4JNZ5_9HYPH|nr:NlpC/P60 family protein [Martelella lutilitoris]TNB47020.1 peptidase P60 [Martelella lutilitoris]
MTGIGLRVVAEAEKWIGTPYRHQAAEIGVGCDCLGLVRGVWGALYGTVPGIETPYAADWAERSGTERLAEAAARYCGPPLPEDQMMPGDILLFRWRSQFAAKHAGILSGPDHFIHAYEQAGVIRSPLVPSWRRRIAGVYRFPAL